MSVAEGRYTVGKWWRQWRVIDWSDSDVVGQLYPTREAAQEAADRATAAAQPKRTQSAVQAGLFDIKEAR